MIPLYLEPSVHARIIEYMGGSSLGDVTTVYLARCDVSLAEPFSISPPQDLPLYLAHGLDIGRSLWDHRSLVAHVDMEYVNFDFPAEAYLDPERSFGLQEPVVSSLRGILHGHGIVPLHLISGRGHHLVWRVGRDSAVFSRLAALGRVPDHLLETYGHLPPPHCMSLPQDLARAFSGLGLVMELLARRTRQESLGRACLPIELTAVEVGHGERGREIISLDISEYGDPLHTRLIRIPFTAYLKPWIKEVLSPLQLERCIPLMTMVPLDGLGLHQAIRVMQDVRLASRLAQSSSVKIPDHSEAMGRLVREYEVSELRAFHDWFYSQEHYPPEAWPATYDRLPLQALPPCGRFILEHPNDLLLKPAGIAHMVRTLMALGWHPRHVAGLMCSKFERDHGWGAHWLFYDSTTRADFYCRIFAGSIVTEREELIDFNCHSTKEKGFCFQGDRDCDLEPFRRSLLQRRKHARLASGPLNGLFLPEEPL